MARQKIKNCVSCNQPFRGRADKKTCSDRCRKRIQRVKTVIAHEAEAVKESAENVLEKIEATVVPSFATEGGFIADTATAPPPQLAQQPAPTIPQPIPSVAPVSQTAPEPTPESVPEPEPINPVVSSIAPTPAPALTPT